MSSPDIIANKLSEESIRTRLSEEFRKASWNEFGLNNDELIAYGENIYAKQEKLRSCEKKRRNKIRKY